MDPANRWRRIIALTDDGYGRLDGAAAVAEDVISQVRGHFDAKEFEQLMRPTPHPWRHGPNPGAELSKWWIRRSHLTAGQLTRPPHKNAWCSSARSGKTSARMRLADEPNH